MSPLRSAGFGLGAGIVLLVLGVTLATRAELVAVSLVRPDTHLFWYLARAAGVISYLALALSVLFGLLLSTGLADAWVSRARSVDVHKWLSAVGLGLLAGHAVAITGDPFVAFDAVDLLVPFIAPYRPFAVGLGVVTGYATVVIFGSFWMRARIGQRGWRLVHYLAFPAVVGATAHGLLAGTDTPTIWMRLMYLAVTALLLWLTAFRIVLVVARSRQASSQPSETFSSPIATT